MRKLLLLSTFAALLALLQTCSVPSVRLVTGTLAGLAFAVAAAFLDRYEPGSPPR
jgi:hypothetical protein